MKLKQPFIYLGISCFLLFAITYFASNPISVEKYYATRFFHLLAVFLRFMFGLIPVSIGDIGYAILLFLLVYRLGRRLLGNQTKSEFSKSRLEKGVFILNKAVIFYLIFQIIWGLNYSRLGIESSMGLKTVGKDATGLQKINEILLQKVNENRRLIPETTIRFPVAQTLFDSASTAYQYFAEKHPFLTYQHTSLKSSVWGWLGSYAGFSGYYNPFTGEAQVNRQIPDFLQPYVSCHEIAHQIGYAKEMDANFAGFLVCREARDPKFRYSAYLEMFLYANQSYFAEDSTRALQIRSQLSLPVQQDLKLLQKFNENHHSFLEPMFEVIFDLFLRSQKQKSGIRSYNKVTAFLIGYYIKYGDL